MIVLEIDIKA